MTGGYLDPTPLARRVALVVGATGSVLAVAFFVFVDLGGTVRGTRHPGSLAAAALWAGPSWIHARCVRTPAVALAGGATLLAATVAALLAVFHDTHSTAGVGVVAFPILLYPLAGGVLAVDRAVADRRAGREAVLRGLARRGLAAALALVVTPAVTLAVVSVADLFDPVPGGGIAGSLVSAAVYAAVAAVGILAMRRLWQ